MIKRIWHGWTTRKNADVYEDLLKNEIFPGIAEKKIRGYKGIELYRRSQKNEVEFMTIMEFDSQEAVKQFAGEDYEQCYVPLPAREVLSRYDEFSQHYEVREKLKY
jgi:hypothetical protein